MTTEFEAAAESIKNATNLSNDDLLSLYSLYKQATCGDCNTSKPGMFDLKGKAKWEAWNKLVGTAKEDAQTQYIAKVTELMK